MTAAFAASPDTPPAGRTARRMGWVLTALLVLLFAMGISSGLLRTPEAVQGSAQMGWPDHLLRPFAVLQLVLVVLYLVPRTAVLGALLWTAYFGGAVAIHVRVGDPVARLLVPVVVAVLVWIALALRDARVRTFLLSSFR